MWPFKKQKVDTVTIPDVVWAAEKSLSVAKDKEIKNTKDLLRTIGANIESAALSGQTRINISARYLNTWYSTPRDILYKNVESALTERGYRVRSGCALDYFLIIEWGDKPGSRSYGQ